jgi:hypothetical protein
MNGRKGENPYRASGTTNEVSTEETRTGRRKRMSFVEFAIGVSGIVCVVLCWFSVSMFFVYPAVSLIAVVPLMFFGKPEKFWIAAIVVVFLQILPVLAMRIRSLGSVYEMPFNWFRIF